jgi:dihydroorotase
VAKRETTARAARSATSGDPRFFLGTDSAPHVDALKEHACGCAGCFTATNTMSILAHVFEEEGALHRLEAFTSLHGPPSTACPRTPARSPWWGEPARYPDKIDTGAGPVTVFDPGFPMACRADHADHAGAFRGGYLRQDEIAG